MPYYSELELKSFGFRSIGKNVKISTLTSIYNPENIEIADNVRIDDFVMLSGRISIKSYSHITPYCMIAGGVPGVFIFENVTLAYGVKVFSQSDDYLGDSLVNSLIPRKFKKEIFEPVYIFKHSVIGANSIILPGVRVNEGVSVGAMTLVNKSLNPWTLNFGVPVKQIKEKSRGLLGLWGQFINEKK